MGEQGKPIDHWLTRTWRVANRRR